MVKLENLIFRYRLLILVIIYVVAFSISSNTGSILTLLARSFNLDLQQERVIATAFAIVGIAGWITRVWASSYIGASVVHSSNLYGERFVASGPYSYTRNPLYLGTLMMSLGFVPLLSIQGSIFLLTALVVVIFELIRMEEKYLEERHGERYMAYKSSVPAILPTFKRYKSEPSTYSIRDGIASEMIYAFIFSPLIGALFFSTAVFEVSFFTLLLIGLASKLALRRKPDTSEKYN